MQTSIHSFKESVLQYTLILQRWFMTSLRTPSTEFSKLHKGYSVHWKSNVCYLILDSSLLVVNLFSLHKNKIIKSNIAIFTYELATWQIHNSSTLIDDIWTLPQAGGRPINWSREMLWLAKQCGEETTVISHHTTTVIKTLGWLLQYRHTSVAKPVQR